MAKEIELKEFYRWECPAYAIEAEELIAYLEQDFEELTGKEIAKIVRKELERLENPNKTDWLEEAKKIVRRREHFDKFQFEVTLRATRSNMTLEQSLQFERWIEEMEEEK